MQAVRYASYYHVCGADRLAFFGSLAWAGTFWDTFGPLCLGASIGLFDLRQYGMHRLVNWLQDTEPTLVAGLMVVRQIAYANPEERFASVRLVHLGGDTIYRQDVEACMRVFPNALIAVGLGCSEAGRLTELELNRPRCWIRRSCRWVFQCLDCGSNSYPMLGKKSPQGQNWRDCRDEPWIGWWLLEPPGLDSLQVPHPRIIGPGASLLYR